MKFLSSVLVCLGILAFCVAGEDPKQLIEKVNAIREGLTPNQQKVPKSFWPEIGVEIDEDIAYLFPSVSRKRSQSETARVEIQAHVNQELLGLISSEGTVLFSSEKYSSITAEIPPSLISTLIERDDVITVANPARAQTNKINVAEGVVNHRVKQFIDAHPEYRGKGIKIGVLSDSVDYLEDSIASGDLPPNVVVLEGQGYRGLDGVGEGTAMLEIIHDMVPEAELYFATAFISPYSFAQNIINLYFAGCQIIVDDVSWSDESPYEDSIIAQAVEAVATGGGVFYFSSAGNSGNPEPYSNRKRNYEADYKPMATDLPGYESVHDFGEGKDFLGVTGGTFFTFMTWSERDFNVASDFDFLFFFENDTLVAISDSFQGYPYDEYFLQGTAEGFPFKVRVGLKYGNPDVAIRLHLWNYGAGPTNFEFATDGVTFGHAATEHGFGVAAIEQVGDETFYDLWINGTQLETEPFSSAGPRRIIFENGEPIVPGNFKFSGGSKTRNKPDITAVDGVATSVPVYFNPFYGTSAAAPNAGAVAAIALSAKPSLQIEELREIFAATSLDILAPGWDVTSGYGVIDTQRIVHHLWENNNCTTVPCLEGGTCSGDDTCMCPAGFSGKFCEVFEYDSVTLEITTSSKPDSDTSGTIFVSFLTKGGEVGPFFVSNGMALGTTEVFHFQTSVRLWEIYGLRFSIFDLNSWMVEKVVAHYASKQMIFGQDMDVSAGSVLLEAPIKVEVHTYSTKAAFTNANIFITLTDTEGKAKSTLLANGISQGSLTVSLPFFNLEEIASVTLSTATKDGWRFKRIFITKRGVVKRFLDPVFVNRDNSMLVLYPVA